MILLLGDKVRVMLNNSIAFDGSFVERTPEHIMLQCSDGEVMIRWDHVIACKKFISNKQPPIHLPTEEPSALPSIDLSTKALTELYEEKREQEKEIIATQMKKLHLTTQPQGPRYSLPTTLFQKKP